MNLENVKKFEAQYPNLTYMFGFFIDHSFKDEKILKELLSNIKKNDPWVSGAMIEIDELLEMRDFPFEKVKDASNHFFSNEQDAKECIAAFKKLLLKKT